LGGKEGVSVNHSFRRTRGSRCILRIKKLIDSWGFVEKVHLTTGEGSKESRILHKKRTLRPNKILNGIPGRGNTLIFEKNVEAKYINRRVRTGIHLKGTNMLILKNKGRGQNY